MEDKENLEKKFDLDFSFSALGDEHFKEICTRINEIEKLEELTLNLESTENLELSNTIPIFKSN